MNHLIYGIGIVIMFLFSIIKYFSIDIQTILYK